MEVAIAATVPITEDVRLALCALPDLLFLVCDADAVADAPAPHRPSQRAFKRDTLPTGMRGEGAATPVLVNPCAIPVPSRTELAKRAGGERGPSVIS